MNLDDIVQYLEQGHTNLLGDVSGAISAIPSLEATRCAPDLIIKFSSEHVRPDSQ